MEREPVRHHNRALTGWGDRWAAPDGPPIVFEHTGCGGAVDQHTVCRTCRRTLDVSDLSTRPGAATPRT